MGVRADAAALEAAARDFGGASRKLPAGVAEPADAAELAAVVRDSCERGLKLVVRGEGHSLEGQCLRAGGLVLRPRRLAAVRVEGDAVRAGAGATWREVEAVLAAAGRTSAVLPDFLGLSVGGTLSVGGIGKGSHVAGAQIDAVRELQVVTAGGEMVRCGPDAHADLFHAVLGGLGYFGVIVEATLATRPAPPRVTVTRERPASAEAGVELLLRELDRESLSLRLVGQRSRWLLERAVAAAPPDEGMPFSAYVDEPGMARFAARPQAVHVWLDVLVPADRAAAALRALEPPPPVQGQASLLVMPVRRIDPPRGSLRAPAAGTAAHDLLIVWLGGPVPTSMAVALRTRAAQALELLRAHGGRRYLVDGLPQDAAAWREHLGIRESDVRALKAQLDPGHLLGAELGLPF